MNYQAQTNINERTRPMFMFVRLTKRTKYIVRVRLFNKRTDTNELPAERFTNCSPNVWFVYSPSFDEMKHLSCFLVGTHLWCDSTKHQIVRVLYESGGSQGLNRVSSVGPCKTTLFKCYPFYQYKVIHHTQYKNKGY
ncbi:hypothetical protein Hanom_Chr06g00482431 [Helianthus anomalus]